MSQNSHTLVSYDLLGVSQHKLDCSVALSYTKQYLDEKCRKFYLFTKLQAKITLNIWSKSRKIILLAITHVVEVTDNINLNVNIAFACKKRVFLVRRWHYVFWWSSGDNKYSHRYPQCSKTVIHLFLMIYWEFLNTNWTAM